MDAQCRDCMNAFEKEQILFNPRMCNTCQHGRKLHELEMKQKENGDVVIGTRVNLRSSTMVNL